MSNQQNPAAWASGWVAFAGFLLIMAGTFWMFQGLAALIEDSFYVLAGDYAFEVDVTTWGWGHMIGGAIAIATGCFVFTGNLLARLLAIVVALLSAGANFLYIPYYPVWSVLIIALDIIVIWALAVYSTDAARSQFEQQQ